MENAGASSTAGTQLKQRLIDVAKSHLSLSPDGEQKNERQRRLAPLLDALSSNMFRLVVMGEVKKGKSSFINAFLGEQDLLPPATNVATSTVYKVVYGPKERITVFFLSDDDDPDKAPPPIEIGRHRLPEFGTEEGNPSNVRQVEFISVELPNPLLAEGVVIVDTPGVGGLFKKHRDITFRYAPNADVVFFILDSVEAVISADEIQFLKELRKNTQRILFLQTKTDLADIEQVLAWKKRNLEVISKALEVDVDRIPYFLVSAKQKQRADRLQNSECLQESGYIELLKYLRENLIPARDEILTCRWLPTLGPELLAAGKLVADRLNIARSAHPLKLAEYESQLSSAEREYDRWQSEVWPGQYRTFLDDVARLKRDSDKQIHDQVSPDHPDCRASVRLLEANSRTADEANAMADQLLDEWAERWRSNTSSILYHFQKSYLAISENLMGRIASEMKTIALPEFDVEVAERRVEKEDRPRVIQEAVMTSNIFSGMAAEAAKYLGIGASVAAYFGIVSNPVGWAIGAAAGVGYVATRIWAAKRGFDVARERQRDAAIASFERALVKTGSTAERSAIRVLQELAGELDSASRAKADGFRLSTKYEFTARRDEILKSKTRTVE